MGVTFRKGFGRRRPPLWSSSAGDFDRRQTEAQGGFEGESHCWTDPIRLEQDKQLGVDALCPRLL